MEVEKIFYYAKQKGYQDLCKPPLKPYKSKRNNSSLNCTYLNIQ